MRGILKGFSYALDTYQVETFCTYLEVILQCYDYEGWSHPPSRVLEGLWVCIRMMASKQEDVLRRNYAGK